MYRIRIEITIIFVSKNKFLLKNVQYLTLKEFYKILFDFAVKKYLLY